MRGWVVSGQGKRARIRKFALLIPVTPHFEAETGLYMTAHTTIPSRSPLAQTGVCAASDQTEAGPDLGAADPNNPQPPAGPDYRAAAFFAATTSL
jgi:hypothetical protein